MDSDAARCLACEEGVPRSLAWGTTDTFVHYYGGNPGTVAPCTAHVEKQTAPDAISVSTAADPSAAKRRREWRRMQMRGGFHYGRSFTAHGADVEAYRALPWHKKISGAQAWFAGRAGLEAWLYKRYGDVIYRGGNYAR